MEEKTMKVNETKLESKKIQKEASEFKSKAKIELENIRHKNIMEELKFMAKNKITTFVRGNYEGNRVEGVKDD